MSSEDTDTSDQEFAHFSEQSSQDFDSRSDSEEVSNDDAKPVLVDEDFRQMPFKDLLQLKRRLGSKVYNEAVFGKSKGNSGPIASGATDKTKIGQKQKPSKNDDSDSDGPPEEVSAKRKVPALGMEKRRSKTMQQRSTDPRFDAKQGYFSGRKFREQYGFINELRSDELVKLKEQLEKEGDPDEAARLQFAIRRTKNQIREFNKQKEQDQKRQDEKSEIRKAVDEGKRPFYEKKSIKKARELVEKYDKLKDTGKLGKHIDKRRKKNTAKDRKKLDFST